MAFDICFEIRTIPCLIMLDKQENYCREVSSFHDCLAFSIFGHGFVDCDNWN